MSSVATSVAQQQLVHWPNLDSICPSNVVIKNKPRIRNTDHNWLQRDAEGSIPGSLKVLMGISEILYTIHKWWKISSTYTTFSMFIVQLFLSIQGLKGIMFFKPKTLLWANYSQTRTNPKSCLQQNNYNEVKKTELRFQFSQ